MRQLLALFTLLGLLIAACGGEKNNDEPTPTATLDTTATVEAGIAVGAAAPAFTLPTSDGSSVSLADYAGKQPVLLFFHMAGG